MHKFIISLLFILVSTNQALAWGAKGHRVTGAIAEQHLSDNAKSKIKEILGYESLAEASTWPDFMRASPDHFWQNVAGPYHYVTVPKGKTYSEVGAPAKGDALSALADFSKTLRNQESTAKDKELALRFIIHIIGDLHQPLHAGNGTDRGGNQFNVTFFNRDTNLHSVWDSGLIEQEGLSFSELTLWLNKKITAEQLQEWQQAEPMDWVRESVAIRDSIYPDDLDISWEYRFTHTHMVHIRLSQAGIRIAAYLNDLYQ